MMSPTYPNAVAALIVDDCVSESNAKGFCASLHGYGFPRASVGRVTGIEQLHREPLFSGLAKNDLCIFFVGPKKQNDNLLGEIKEQGAAKEVVTQLVQAKNVMSKKQQAVVTSIATGYAKKRFP